MGLVILTFKTGAGVPRQSKRLGFMGVHVYWVIGDAMIADMLLAKAPLVPLLHAGKASMLVFRWGTLSPLDSSLNRGSQGVSKYYDVWGAWFGGGVPQFMKLTFGKRLWTSPVW